VNNRNNGSPRRPNRSDAYQQIYLEICCPDEVLSTYSNEESVYKRLNPFSYNEDVAELEEQLRLEFWRVVNESLTTRQKDVVRLYADGYTQQEIAKMLKINQSSITKALNGNVDYKNGKKVYGGLKKRLKKLIETDEKIQIILKNIADLRDENWL
jgi:DNA-binding CsgD family transcriptional regulator